MIHIMEKILLVEDDINLAFILVEELRIERFEVLHLSKGKDVLLAIDDFRPDIILLDVNLQSTLNGFEIAKKIRFSSNLPIIFTTSRTLSEDLEIGFSIGNVDYLKKPFGICELTLRIKEMLSRNLRRDHQIIQYQIGEYLFNPSEKLLQINDEKIRLQKNECAVLTLLCKSNEKVVKKDDLLMSVWNDLDLKQKEASLYNIVSSLRNKLKRDEKISITAFPKIGWKLTKITTDSTPV